jgi:histidine triad (HIT) family protein
MDPDLEDKPPLSLPVSDMVVGLVGKIARSPLGRRIIAWIFSHMSFIIPVKRLRETGNLLAFHHPSPSYPVHILIVPKSKIASLFELEEEDNRFLVEVFRTAKSLVEELGLSESGYRLVLNGGKYQEFPHLHFHLISTKQGHEDSIAPNTGRLEEA